MRAGAARPDRAVNDSLLPIDGRTARVGTTGSTVRSAAVGTPSTCQP